MTRSAIGTLLGQGAVHDLLRRGDLPPWAAAHYRSFREALLGDEEGTPFPCHFGAESERAGNAFYTFVDSPTDPDALFGLRSTLLAYLDAYGAADDRASLVAFFRPAGEEREADYHERVWHVLQFLHVHDPEPWPADIPTDPTDTRWEFCFGGEPIFPTCRAPFYGSRRSRFCPVGLEITFQPRALFDGVTADTEAGRAAREAIRGRLVDYDDAPVHPDIGDWPTDHEWPQYLLREDPDQAPDEPPIRITREHPKAVVEGS